jgi:GT2 family glycosyltransferase
MLSKFKIYPVRNETNLGFAKACNKDHFTKEQLHFNNTRKSSDWLPLCQAANGDGAIGAVGGKLLFPDGTLRAAPLSGATAQRWVSAGIYLFMSGLDFCCVLAGRRHFSATGRIDKSILLPTTRMLILQE